MKKFIIITTINQKTKAVKKFSRMLKDWHIVLVGDKKSKTIKNENNITFLSINDQKKLSLKTADICPYNHYARKNIGYLYAIKSGADMIYDTDDDNIPYNDWKFPDFKYNKCLTSEKQFINIYKYFTDADIWPRGYPLDAIRVKGKTKKNTRNIKVGIWQGLADIDPDVDAIFRLTTDKKIIFNRNKPIVLGKNTYCPFNSQNTLWHKDSFALLYLPSTVSFRFTDILRGYIAQRLLWENNRYLGFTKASVYQERNPHNLMKDFKDELECYLNVRSIIEIMDCANFNADYLASLKKIYTILEKHGIVTKVELKRLSGWIYDIKNN